MVEKLLQDWDLSGIQHKNFHELSMGQKMRTLIVRALATCPKLLFLDEPLSSLDFHCQKLLMEQLQLFKEQHGTLSLVIDHHMARFSQGLDGFLVFERTHNHRLTHLYFSQENPEESLNGTVKQH